MAAMRIMHEVWSPASDLPSVLRWFPPKAKATCSCSSYVVLSRWGLRVCTEASNHTLHGIALDGDDHAANCHDLKLSGSACSGYA